MHRSALSGAVNVTDTASRSSIARMGCPTYYPVRGPFPVEVSWRGAERKPVGQAEPPTECCRSRVELTDADDIPASWAQIWGYPTDRGCRGVLRSRPGSWSEPWSGSLSGLIATWLEEAMKAAMRG